MASASAQSTPATSALPVVPSSDVASVVARVNAWNAALNAHNTSALGALYLKQVCYYGHIVSSEAILKQKANSFGPGSTFAQLIVGDVEVERTDDHFVLARFTKRSGPRQRLRDTPARLVLRQDPDGKDWRLLEEADEGNPDGSSANVGACARSAWFAVVQEHCEEAASRAVHAMPRVKQMEDELIEGSTEGHALGGMGPEDNGDGTFSGSIGVNSAERFEARVDYTVVRTTGHLTVSVDGTEVSVPETVQHDLANACNP